MAATQTITDYEIHLDQVLGEGGMGVVYHGLQVSLGRNVAVKIIREDFTDNPAFVGRFRQEAELLAQVIDGHVVQVFGAGEWEGRHFYAMELVDGRNLAQRAQGGRPFSTAEILHVADGVGNALRAAWKFQIVHRDIKPSNILYTADGAVKVADFGLAKCVRGDPAQTLVLAGTARYLSPEQGMGEPVDIRSDIYSLGIVLYEMATSRLPFEGSAPTTLIYQHVHADPPPPRQVRPDLPEVLEAFILRCLAKRPGDRFQTPDELLAAAQEIRQRIEAAPTTPGTPASPTPESFPDAPFTDSESVNLPLGDGSAGPAPPPAEAAAADVASRRDPDIIATKTDTPTSEDDVFPAALPRNRSRRSLAAAVLLVSAAAGAWAVYRWLGTAPEPSDTDRRRKAIELALGLGDYAEAMSLSERYFGRDSAEYRRARERYREGRAREWEGKAKDAMADRDWTAAAKAYEVLREFADPARSEELSAGLAFCRDLAAASKEEAGNAWERALDIYRRRLPSAGEHRAYLLQAVRRIGGKLAAQAERSRGMAAWNDGLRAAHAAREAFAAAGEAPAELGALVRELETAAAAPSGFAYVPAGPFSRGADDGPLVERPRHRAETVVFYIGVREVSRGEYARFLASAAARTHEACHPDEPAGKDHTPDGWSRDLPLHEPVTGIDWFDAAAYARWAGLRLPTEAEWEKAAAFDPGRETGRAYPYGDTYDAAAGDIAFLGLQGMAGGPVEWTQSEFDAYPGANARHAEFGQGHRVLRGGVLDPEDAAAQARTAHRYWQPPTRRDRRFGFRCVKDAR